MVAKPILPLFNYSCKLMTTVTECVSVPYS